MTTVQLQEAKLVVRAFHGALDQAGMDQIAAVIGDAVAPDYLWCGFHPFGELRRPEEVADRFWVPLRKSLTRLQRREDIFFSGYNEIDGFKSIWAVSMGHLVGLFDETWLGIRPTRKMAFLRYCEFHRIEDGRIAETAMYFDIPHFMMQAGQNPFGPQTAAFMVQPGPMTHDGLLFDPQPHQMGKATLDLINVMISDLGQWQSGLMLEDELARSWADDMTWWGPHGIGSTYTIERYAKQHSGPFRAGFADRSKSRHRARLAEGHYGGFFGWPSFTARSTGGFMGMPATDRLAEFRVIDIYRREGSKLAENGVFIDLLHAWKTQGVDILKRFSEI